MCGHNGSTDYSQNYHHNDAASAAALSYYSQAADLSNQTGQNNGPVPGATPTSGHYASTLGHISSSAHQFPEHHTGIISEPNGLSYTNLDSHGYGPGHTHNPHTAVAPNQPGIGRMPPSPYSTVDGRNANGGVGVGGVVGGGGLSVSANCQSLNATVNGQTAAHTILQHQGYPQYRDFSSPDSVPSSHPSHQDMVSALTDCAVMRSTGSGQPTVQYPYLEPSLLSRRNGNHPGLSAYDTAAFQEMSCSQLNGSPYHLNHLTSHLHHPAHHHHHHHGGRSGSNAVTAAAPVPTYKWMQVKRNVPKPGKFAKNSARSRLSAYLMLFAREIHACQAN